MYTQVLRVINFRISPALQSICKSGVCDVKGRNINRIQVATITSKLLRDRSIKKPNPWPYETKKYGLLAMYYDQTVKRFDENTKLIIVEGNIASGKSSLAKTLADELEMLYMPEPTMDQIYILDNGFDLRQIDHLLPRSYNCCDIKTFYENPHHHRLAIFQLNMFRLRFEQYCNAMTHILNTGQGVILERCVHSDFIFTEAMYKCGYFNKGVHWFYNQSRENSMWQLRKPHLVVYLDVPSEILLQRIKERNIPYEVNSKVLTKEYLDTLDHFYKQNYLKFMSDHAELLIYDWSNYGDTEVVVEDIERIDFNKYGKYDVKLQDWRCSPEELNEMRYEYTNTTDMMMMYTYYSSFDVPEVLFTADDNLEYKKVMLKYVPGIRYAKGFNKGEGYNLFKTKQNYRELQKYTFHPLE